MALLPDTLPGEKLLVRIWETAEKSYIGLARPWLIRREGTAKAAAEYQNKLALGQAEADLEEVKAGRARYDVVAGKLIPLMRPLPIQPKLETLPAAEQLPTRNSPENRPIPRLGSALDFATHTLLQSTVKEMGRTINLEKILQKAEAEAEGVPNDAVSDVLPSADWVARWREGAQDVTIEQMQLFWARLLAGEVKRPGSFSLRTLDFIRSASVADAGLVEKIAPFVFSSSFVYRHDALLLEHKITFDDLLTLQSIGVISGVGGNLTWNMKRTHPPSMGVISCHDLQIFFPVFRSEIRLPSYMLTPLGEELLKLGDFKGHYAYFRAIAVQMGESHGIPCVLRRLIRTGPKSGTYEEGERFGPTDEQYRRACE